MGVVLSRVAAAPGTPSRWNSRPSHINDSIQYDVSEIQHGRFPSPEPPRASKPKGFRRSSELIMSRIHVGDLDRSVSFYEHHFGFKSYFQHVVPGGPRIAYLKLGDTVLELTHTQRVPYQGFTFAWKQMALMLRFS